MTALVRIEVAVCIDLSPALTSALSQLLQGMQREARPVSDPRPPPSPPSPAPDVPKRRPGRPRKDETRPKEVATEQSAVSQPLRELEAAFQEMVNRPGGEMRALAVMTGFGLADLGDARPEQYPTILRALRSAAGE